MVQEWKPLWRDGGVELNEMGRSLGLNCRWRVYYILEDTRGIDGLMSGKK